MSAYREKVAGVKSVSDPGNPVGDANPVMAMCPSDPPLVMKEGCIIGGSRGGVPGARLLRVQILSFRQTKFSKCNCLGNPRPPYEVHAPLWGILDPPLCILKCETVHHYIITNHNTTPVCYYCNIPEHENSYTIMEAISTDVHPITH